MRTRESKTSPATNNSCASACAHAHECMCKCMAQPFNQIPRRPSALCSVCLPVMRHAHIHSVSNKPLGLQHGAQAAQILFFRTVCMQVLAYPLHLTFESFRLLWICNQRAICMHAHTHCLLASKPAQQSISFMQFRQQSGAHHDSWPLRPGQCVLHFEAMCLAGQMLSTPTS